MAHSATQRSLDKHCYHNLGDLGQGALAKAWPGSCADGAKKRKLRIKPRPATQKPAMEAQQSGWSLAGKWLDSIDSQAMLAIPEEMSPLDLDLDLAFASFHALPDVKLGHSSLHGMQRNVTATGNQATRSQGTSDSAVLDKGTSAQVTLPHLPDIQIAIPAQSQFDDVEHRWLGQTTTSNAQTYEAFPRWANAHSRQCNQDPFDEQPRPHTVNRSAPHLGYSAASLATHAPSHMPEHLSAIPQLAQATSSAHAAQPGTEAPGARGLSARHEAAAMERLQQLNAEAKECMLRDSRKHTQAMEEERQRHALEVQKLRETQQALIDDLQKKTAVIQKEAEDLQKQLAEERAHRQAAAQAGQESALLRQAMEFRIGIQEPSDLLTGRQEFSQQAEIAQKFWVQFETASSAAGVSGGPNEGCKDPDTPGKFNEAAQGVCKGLLSSVMLLNSGAHQFHHGLDDVSRRRNDLVEGRSRIRQSQDKLRKVGLLISRLSEANAVLASAGATIERDEEYARRAVFVQAASVCQRRLVTLGENEYLAFERISVQQTRQHAHSKHVEFVRLRETLKQLSPASDTSCADVATISPRAHARSGRTSGGSGGGMNDSTQTLLDLGHVFYLSQKRLEASVDSALKVTQEAPRLREDLLRLFNALGRVGSERVASKGRSIAWSMAAITGEFGCNVNQNVGTLQFAVETLKSLLVSDSPAKSKGTKRKHAS